MPIAGGAARAAPAQGAGRGEEGLSRSLTHAHRAVTGAPPPHVSPSRSHHAPRPTAPRLPPRSSYLTELLLDKGYIVHGLKRRASSYNHPRLEHIMDASTFSAQGGSCAEGERGAARES